MSSDHFVHGYEQLAVGRTADILLLSPTRVLKLFFEGTAPEAVADEAKRCATAHAIGATPIAVHGEQRLGTRLGLVFDALQGDSLTRLAERNLLLLRRSGRILARVHAGLHGLTTRGLPEVRETVAAQLGSGPLAFLKDTQRSRAATLIENLPSGSSILHMDFHTNNVFQHGDGYAVIDWATALRGAPAADVAFTWFLFNEAELFPGTPFQKRLLYGAARRIVGKAYIGEYRRITGMTQAQIDAWRLPTLVNRLATWNIVSERSSLQREILTLIEGLR